MPDDQPAPSNPQNQQPIRVSSLWATWQIGANLVWAYTGSLAVDLGATGIQQSTVTAVQTIGNASLQWAWGSLSDRFGRRPFLFLGLLAVGITAALIPFAQTAWQLILLLLVPTIIGSAAIPAWNGLLGDITTLKGRGRFVGLITAIGTVASAVALVVIGFLATSIGLSGIAEYQVPMYTAAVSLGVSVVVVLVLTETIKPSKRRVFQLKSAVKSTPRFIPFLIINTFFFASMGAAWPLFPIITRGILNVSLFFIGVFTAIFSISSGIAQLTGGWITDRYGRKPVLFVSRFAIFFVPILHSIGAITGNMWFLVPSNILGGSLTGFYIVSSTAWLLDSSPVKHRGGVVALFNFCTGASSFLAAMISGLILDYLILFIPYITAVIMMMFTIAILRFFTSLGYLKVNETLVKTPAAPVPQVPAPARAG
jgi:MFS family permease